MNALLIALEKLDNVQFIDNTNAEAAFAKADVTNILLDLSAAYQREIEELQAVTFPPRMIIDGKAMEVENIDNLPMSNKALDVFYHKHDETVGRVPVLFVKAVK